MAELSVARRDVVVGAAVLVGGAVVGFVLARSSDAARASTGGAANQYGAVAPSGGKQLAALASVPDGGGLVVGKVVLTRSGDQVHAFSAVCTHQGCTVSGVKAGAITCPCHGSRFDPATGKVVGGPAPSPLPPVQVEVRDGAVWTA